MVTRHQTLTQLLAVDASPGFPAHLEDRVGRPQTGRGIAVAVEAELHEQGFFLRGQRHSVDPAVAGFAGHPVIDVGAVIEAHVVGQVVDPPPAQGLVVTQAVMQISLSGTPANEDCSTEVWQ